jgi:hypothetical protein
MSPKKHDWEYDSIHQLPSENNAGRRLRQFSVVDDGLIRLSRAVVSTETATEKGRVLLVERY